MKKYYALILLFIGSNFCFAQVFVNQASNGSNDGTSWENAYIDLDAAINSTSSGEIWVAAGTYKPSTDVDGEVPSDDRENTFRLKENLALFGGFIGNETSLSERNWNQNETILSGDIGIESDSTDNTYHVVSAEYADLDLSTILDGLIISDGYSYSQKSGAGIYVNQTSGGKFIIRNCIIENNYSYRDGGGLYVFNSDPIIENNIFRNNQAFEGGAIYLYYSDAIVQNNEIINNKADNYENVGSSSLSGGGIYVSSYSSPIIKNNLIQGNFARHEGGGVTIDDNYHTVFESNTVLENTSQNGGGLFLDFSRTFFFNNIFAKNHASENGGAIYMDYTPGPKLLNNTITNNSAEQNGGGLYLSAANVDIINSILYSNTAPSGSQAKIFVQRSDWFPKIRNCTLEGGEQGISSNENITYEDNLSISPEFSNINNNAFDLLGTSELIDAGTIDPTLIDTPWTGSNGQIIEFSLVDIIGNTRIYNDVIDIGAFEAQTPRQFAPTDISISNNQVDQSDLIGSLIGEFATLDTDSEEFEYEVTSSNKDCFKIEGSSLITNCHLTQFTISPIEITVRSTDEDGWSIEKSFNIEILNIITGTRNEVSFDILTYPNPSRGMICVENLPADGAQVIVTSIDGKRVLTSSLNKQKSTLNVEHLPRGVYTLIIEVGVNVLTRRIILTD